MARIFTPVTNSGQANSATLKGRQTRGISPARRAAFEILRRVEQEGAYASVLLATRDDDLSDQDRALSHELTMGVLRWQLMLDHLIAHFAGRDPERLDLPVRLVLRLGLYQLRFLSRIPASAAVNEAVNLVRFAGVRSADKFVNGVLRRAIREADYDPLSRIQDSAERLAVETSHPRWLIERWVMAFGSDEARQLALANNAAAPISFRVVGRESDENDVLDQLRSAGGEVVPSEIVANAWRMKGGGNSLRQLSRAGQVYIQDEASQLVAHALMAQSGQRVLDLCAAPGSKATHIAGLTGSETLVIAGDLNEHRLRVVAEAGRLQHLGGLQSVVLDGRQSLPFTDGLFDRVLVDAPCSGTGTLRRNPEIRWRISPRDISELSKRQKQLLFNAARAVKPGGSLLYSTCSVEPEENEEVAAAFLQVNDSFSPIGLPVDPKLLTETGDVRTWPHREGTDGFFISGFERKKRNTSACGSP